MFERTVVIFFQSKNLYGDEACPGLSWLVLTYCMHFLVVATFINRHISSGAVCIHSARLYLLKTFAFCSLKSTISAFALFSKSFYLWEARPAGIGIHTLFSSPVKKMVIISFLEILLITVQNWQQLLLLEYSLNLHLNIPFFFRFFSYEKRKKKCDKNFKIIKSSTTVHNNIHNNLLSSVFFTDFIENCLFIFVLNIFINLYI